MKVVLFAPHFAEYTLRFAQALRSHAEVEVLIERGALRRELTSDLLRSVRRSGVKLTLFSANSRSRKLAAVLRILWRTIAARPRIVHAPEYPEPYFTLLLRALGLGIPIVLTVHDPQPHSGSDFAYAQRRRRDIDLQRSLAAGFAAHGDYCRTLLAAQLRGSRPIADVPHGPLLAPEEPDPSPPEGPCTLLFFGRIEAYKGLDLFLDAVELLNSRGVAVCARVCGRGSELERLRPRLETIPNVGVEARHLSPRAAMAKFRLAHIVVAPYRDATQSGVIASAFGNGRPAVATRVGGLVDYVYEGSDGVLCPPDNAVALADALEALIGNPERRAAMGLAAVAAARGRLSWRKAASTAFELYEAILSKPGVRRP